MDASPHFPHVLAHSRWRTWLTYFGLLVVCTAILYARKPDMFQRPQFWAEDGGLFFLNAYEYGWHSLFFQYGGYLDFLLRLVALIADGLDPSWAPTIYVGASVVLTLWVASRALSPRFPLEPRWICAVMVVLVPDTFELLLTLTNLHFVLAAGLVAILVSADPHTRGEKIHDVMAAALVGLTGPFSTLLAPLFVWRAASRRSLWSSTIGSIVVITGLAQLSYLIRFPVAEPAERSISAIHGLVATGSRVGGSLLLGKWVPNPPSIAAGIALASITLIGIACLVLRRGSTHTQRIWMGVAFAALLSATIYRCRFVLPSLTYVGFGARYFYPIQLIAMWLIASLLRESAPARRAIGASVLLVMLVTNIPRLREPSLIDMHWGDYVDRIRAGEEIRVPINPGGWSIPLPGRH